MSALTPNERRVIIEIIELVYQLIENRMPFGMPSGELYAMLMAKMSLTTYQQLIQAMEAMGRITIANHLIRTTEPVDPRRI